MRQPARHLGGLFAAASLFVVTSMPAAADAPAPVDESRLQPALSPTFTSWDCQLKKSGPVCSGERHLSTDWEPLDFPCGDTPLFSRYDEDRYQTRYYNLDYLDDHREFRSTQVDHIATTPEGPATATISSNVRFEEPFAVPGDDTTRTIVTHGILWDIRPVQGAAVWRAVGTLVEPPDAVGTFSGMVTSSSGNTRYEDAPLPEVLSDDTFFAAVCEAATAGG